MDAVTSHSTRSTFKFLLPMVIPSAIAAIASALIFSHFHEKSTEEAERTSIEQLSVVAQGVSEQILVAAQGYQALVNAASLSGPEVLQPISGIRYFTKWKGSETPVFFKVGSFESRRAQIETNLGLETLKAFEGVRHEKGTSKIFFARPDVQQSREWIGFFYLGEMQEVSGIWIDPLEAFSIAKRKAEVRTELALVKIALVTLKGKVLSATVPEYSGGDFSGVKGFSEFLGQAPTGEFPSADDWSVRVFKRVQGFPMAVIVEKVEDKTSGFVRMMKDPELRTRLLGFFVLFCGAWGLISFAIAWKWAAPGSTPRASPRTVPAVQTPVQTGVSTLVPPPVLVAPSPPVAQAVAIAPAVAVAPVPEKPVAPVIEPFRQPEAVQKTVADVPGIMTEAIRDEWKLRKFLDEERLISDYERRSFMAKTPREVSEQLVLVASELCKSPSLYFAYYRPTGQMILQAHAGLEAVGPIPALAFPVPHQSITKYAGYEPLQNLILARFGTAHFEAHAVTAFGTLGRIASRPQILGVLVVLQSNVDSALHQESLSRLMRTTGLIYENAVLAQ
ncbi:MAG: hypothetical protein JNL01_12090 [Bdellovibrionales bacterium]|nr:hypothetical protein [Bdellovibrionales bacterium]